LARGERVASRAPCIEKAPALRHASAKPDERGVCMNPGGFRIDLSKVPAPMLGMFSEINATFRSAWTLSERTREIIRLYSAFENQCHT
jgi:hypothetical protein